MFLTKIQRSLPITLVLFCAFCLLPSAFSATQSEAGQLQASPSPTPSTSPLPSPSPTPVTGLHQWGAVTLFHGLPSDRVHAIAQGADGSMWFGTEAGLAKFDGRRTQTITISSLAAGRVIALQSDQTGAIWVGTQTGAARMFWGHFDVVTETLGQTVTTIIAPDPGRVLLATEQGNIYETRTAADGSIQTKSLLTQPLESADREHPGSLVITSLAVINNKLVAGSMSRGLLTIEDGMAREVETRPSLFFIRALELDGKGRLWLGARVKKDEPGLLTGSGFSNFLRNDLATGTVTTVRTFGDDVWAATDGHGVFLLANGKKPTRLTFDGTAGGLRSDHVYTIFQDREGVIWFGTDRGVCRYDPSAPIVEQVGTTSQSNFVRALYQTSDGTLLCGTNQGLFVYDNAAAEWQTVENLSRNAIYAIAEDQSGRLLVGAASGFFVSQRSHSGAKIRNDNFDRLETGSGEVDAPGNVRAVALFQGNTYIASFGRGLARIEGSRARLLWPTNADAPQQREVITLYAEAEMRLLIGTIHDELFVFDGHKTEADPSFAALQGSGVRGIDRSSDGTLWFATSRGIYICRPGAQCKVLVADVDARSVFANHSDNNIEAWFATIDSGLLKIRFDVNLGAIVSRLDAEQGLPSQSVFAVLPIKDNQGNEAVLIGTSRGVARYRPGRLTPTLYATRVISKRVHSPAELANGLSLEYPQNSLLFEVAAISSRTFPEQFQYAFTLLDDKNAVIRQKLSRESQFAIEGLAPGRYRVTARAFSKDLIASEPLSFELGIAKAPFPWTSTALAILLALALLALLWAILERRRIARTSAALVAANHELADARLDLANEAERERRRIARDLHDQTLADLRHLMLLSDRAPANGEAGRQLDPAVLRTEIESISQEVRRICEDLSPSVLQNVGFAAALEFALSHAVHDAPPDRRFEHEFVCDESLEEQAQLPTNVQMQIYRLVQEAVSNIWRHAGATHVKMSVQATPNGDFVLQLKDNGRDFDPDEQKHFAGRGLANMKARASLIGAEISWEKQEGGGTVFTLLLKRAAA
ncbi:MAG TPA: two-component regulator propeller domain-containing protein [Pyrinomonadaceae bacterium]|nr:two-component regulator propeller domain-containing protein [Pyrinomonadaceae bacterium]